jgi:hypothetical protein
MSGKLLDEHGVPIVTPLRLTLAIVAGFAVTVVGAALGNETVVVAGPSIILIAFCVAIPVWRNRRYRDQPLAKPPAQAAVYGNPLAVEATGRRAVRRVRRRAGMTYMFVALGAALCVATVVAPGTHVDGYDVLFAGIGAFMCVGSLATGPVACFVVSPRYLDIRTANRIVRVPRAVIAEFTQGQQHVTLQLSNHESVRFRVDSVLWSLFDRSGNFTNPRSQVRTIRRIVSAMREVPPVQMPGDVQVERIERRWLVTGLVMGGLVLLAGTLIAASSIG